VTHDAAVQRLAARYAPWLPARLAAIAPGLDRAREVLNFAARRSREVRLAQVAGSLTFTTTLSLVPLLAVVLSLLTALPIFTELRVAFEKNVLRGLLPDAYASVMLRYLNEFVAKAGRLTALGLAFLSVTALAMVFTVDRVLNDIWRVRAGRPLLQRLLIYWALLTLGPVVIAASLSASSYLLSASHGWIGRAPGLFGELLDYAPVLISGLAFAALYVIVPARRVLWRDALVGGFAAALFGQLMKSAFGWYLQTGTLAGIYGAFAVAPLFLLWAYLTWYAILFGAALAATLPQLRLTRFADEQRAGNRFVTAVALLRNLLDARQRDRRQGKMSLDDLALSVRTYPEEIERLLAELERLDYVSRIDGTPSTWLLTCDPARATLQPAFEKFAVDPSNSLIAGEDATLRAWTGRGLAAGWITEPLLALTASRAD
jgi:membrane protein